MAIRDLDQTSLGILDPVRVGLSLATAAGGSDLPGVTTAGHEAHKLVASLHGRDDSAKVGVVDAAYWMKNAVPSGGSAMGYSFVLAEEATKMGACLVDIKKRLKRWLHERCIVPCLETTQSELST